MTSFAHTGAHVFWKSSFLSESGLTGDALKGSLLHAAFASRKETSVHLQIHPQNPLTYEKGDLVA